MTQPTTDQITSYMTHQDPDANDFSYPKTWSEVVGFSLWRFGVLGMLVVMIAIQFYYAQQQNIRSERLADKMMDCITAFTVSQQKSTILIENVNSALMKHQSWEEQELKELIPQLHRIERATYNSKSVQ